MNIISQIYCLNYLASLINSNILKLESDHYLVFKYHKKRLFDGLCKRRFYVLVSDVERKV